MDADEVQLNSYLVINIFSTLASMNGYAEKTIKVTTSWDDGSPGDLRIRDLLQKYGLAGTFYIPGKNSERPVMAARDILELARGCEIGSHTYSHRVLPGLPLEEMKGEIIRGKDCLEQLLGREVPCFCYPKGKFNRRVVQCAEEAGVKAARTTMAFQLSPVCHPFRGGTALQVFPQRPIIHLRHGLKELNFQGVYRYIAKLYMASDWKELAINLFDMAADMGGVYHLWGHSWEIEEYGLWQDLEMVFKYVARRRDASYLTNGQLTGIVAQKRRSCED